MLDPEQRLRFVTIDETATVPDIEAAIYNLRGQMIRCGRATRRYYELDAEIDLLFEMRANALLEAEFNDHASCPDMSGQD